MYSAHFLIPKSCEAYLYRWADVMAEIGPITDRSLFWADHEVTTRIPNWLHVVIRADDKDDLVSNYLYQTDRVLSGMNPLYHGYVYADGEKYANMEDFTSQ